MQVVCLWTPLGDGRPQIPLICSAPYIISKYATVWALILYFCVDVHMKLTPSPSICVHLVWTPLRVDVINGWPLFEKLKLFHSFVTTILFRDRKTTINFPS